MTVIALPPLIFRPPGRDQGYTLSILSWGKEVVLRSGTPLLANLHLVHLVTRWHLATTSPPPSRPHAGIFASHSRGYSGLGVPQFRCE
jgi:hypothetical protein